VSKLARHTLTHPDGRRLYVYGDLRGALDQLEGRVEAHDRSVAGRKAGRTRRRKAEQRSAAARKAARKRATAKM